MHDTLTDADRDLLFKMAGIDPASVAADANDVEPEPEPVTVVVEDTTVAAVVAEFDTDAVATQLLAKAKGNQDTAKQLSIKWATEQFDKVKLSKIAAAQLGVDRSTHNKAEYARIQREREAVNSAMRRMGRGHVATKIAKANKPQANPQLDAFLLAHQGNPEVTQLLALLGHNG